MRILVSHRVVSILAMAMAVGGAALLQGGCLGDADRSESTGDEPTTAEAKQAPGDEDAAESNALAAGWTAQFISVDHAGRKVLDIPNGAQVNGLLAQLWDQNGEPQQTWFVAQHGGAGTYTLKNASSGKCLDMATDGPVGNGTRVQQWTCNSLSNQDWIAGGGSGWVTLRNRNSNLCLDVKEANFANGAQLQVWQCGGAWNQRWNIFP